MRKVILVLLVVFAASALLTTGAFACGDKKSDTEKAKVDKDAKTQLVDSKSKICPAKAAGICGSKKKPAATASTEDGKFVTRTISVKGMTGTTCENTISVALASVPGVVEVVEVCYKGEKAVVKVDAEKSKDDLLVTAITNKGYQAEVIPAVAKSAETAPKAKVCPLSGGPGCESKTAKTSTEKKAEESD